MVPPHHAAVIAAARRGSSGSADPAMSSADDPAAVAAAYEAANTMNIPITDDMRVELGLLPFDPAVRFKHGYLAKRQKCRYAVIPVYSKEERLLFAKLLRDSIATGAEISDWPHMTKLWNPFADGRLVFYKLPQHLNSYFRLLSDCALAHAIEHPSQSRSRLLGAGITLTSRPESSFERKLDEGDMQAMMLAVAVAAAYLPGLGATKEQLVSARNAADISSIERMIDSLDVEVYRQLEGRDAQIDPATGFRKRGRKPGAKNSRIRMIDLSPTQTSTTNAVGSGDVSMIAASTPREVPISPSSAAYTTMQHPYHESSRSAMTSSRRASSALETSSVPSMHPQIYLSQSLSAYEPSGVYMPYYAALGTASSSSAMPLERYALVSGASTTDSGAKTSGVLPPVQTTIYGTQGMLSSGAGDAANSNYNSNGMLSDMSQDGSSGKSHRYPVQYF
ncbi:uncharacterized protein V1518DRAFT_406987 [Limtongia smithiae]|uniref:uncharacterized protein n=1 Tax=Limtongia smithiae TaxID=1125753 RepID=UPI0034D01484